MRIFEHFYSFCLTQCRSIAVSGFTITIYRVPLFIMCVCIDCNSNKFARIVVLCEGWINAQPTHFIHAKHTKHWTINFNCMYFVDYYYAYIYICYILMLIEMFIRHVVSVFAILILNFCFLTHAHILFFYLFHCSRICFILFYSIFCCCCWCYFSLCNTKNNNSLSQFETE